MKGKQHLVKFLMRNPGHFDDVVLLDRPSARHVQEITETIQVALNSGIHLVLLHQRNDGTLGTTTDRTTHLQRSASRSRCLRLSQTGEDYGDGERFEGRQLGVELINPLLQHQDIILRELGLLHLLCSTM